MMLEGKGFTFIAGLCGPKTGTEADWQCSGLTYYSGDTDSLRKVPSSRVQSEGFGKMLRFVVRSITLPALA